MNPYSSRKRIETPEQFVKGEEGEGETSDLKCVCMCGAGGFVVL